MQNFQNSPEEYAILLKEVMLTPSAEVKENRFNDSEANAAGCSGKCISGKCKALV